MNYFMRNSGIPLKVSMGAVIIFALGIAYVAYFSARNFNGELDERLKSNARTIAESLGDRFLMGQTETDEVIGRWLEAEPLLLRIALVEVENGAFVFSSDENDSNQTVSPQLMDILQKGFEETAYGTFVTFLDGGEAVQSIQYSFKVNDPEASVNPAAYVQILYDWREVNERKKGYFNALMLICSFVVILCFLFVFFLQSRISIFLLKINLALEGMAKGVLNVNLPDRRDELGAIVTAMGNLRKYLASLVSSALVEEKASGAPPPSSLRFLSSGRRPSEAVFVKIGWELAEEVSSSDDTKIAEETIKKNFERLFSHFSGFGGEILAYEAGSSTLVFFGENGEDRAAKALSTLYEKTVSSSQASAAPRSDGVEFRSALHRGVFFAPRFEEGEKTFDVLLGAGIAQLKEMHRSARNGEILVSSVVRAKLSDDFELVSVNSGRGDETENNAFCRLLGEKKEGTSGKKAEGKKDATEAEGLDPGFIGQKNNEIQSVAAMVEETFHNNIAEEGRRRTPGNNAGGALGISAIMEDTFNKNL